MKVAFLDRDGTLNKDYSDREWSNIIEPEILPGTIDGLKFLKNKGYTFIIITNQYIIGEGYISREDYYNFNKKLFYILKNQGIEIFDTFYCFHSRDEDCNCHKPSKGMILDALNKYKNIDLYNSILIGDSKSDKMLAESMGIDFYGINIECDNSISDLSDIKSYF